MDSVDKCIVDIFETDPQPVGIETFISKTKKTGRTVLNHFQKINDLLIKNKFDPIFNKKNIGYVLAHDSVSYLQTSINYKKHDFYHIKNEILFDLLCTKCLVSISSVKKRYNLSTNTAIKYFKEINIEFFSNDLILAKNKNGRFIKGTEENIRLYINKHYGQIYKINKHQLNPIVKELNYFLNINKINLTEISKEFFVRFYSLILSRIRSFKSLFSINNKLDKIIFPYKNSLNLKQVELYYLNICLNCCPYQKLDTINDINCIFDKITRFGQVKDKVKLKNYINNLIVRIKNHIFIRYEKIVCTYDNLIFNQLKKILKIKIPDDEIMLLSFFINKQYKSKPKVLCVADDKVIANALCNEIKGVFPQVSLFGPVMREDFRRNDQTWPLIITLNKVGNPGGVK